LVVVVAVKDFDVDTRFSHAAREKAELPGDILLQSLDENLAFVENANSGCFQCLAGGEPIFKEEVSDAYAANDPGPPSLDTHSGAAQGLTHLGKSARTIFEGDC
jgi:hypothetical protein